MVWSQQQMANWPGGGEVEVWPCHLLHADHRQQELLPCHPQQHPACHLQEQVPLGFILHSRRLWWWRGNSVVTHCSPEQQRRQPTFLRKRKKKKNDTRSFWTATRTKKVGFAPWRTFRLQGQVIGHTFCGYLSIHRTAIMHLHVLLFSHYVLSDSLWPYILRHSRLPWLHVLDAAYSNFLFPISWKGTVISSVLELRKFVWQDYFLWMSFP